MLELKGWAINSGRKCHFPGEFFTQDKKGERQRNEAKGWFLTTLNWKDFLCSWGGNTGERGSNCASGKVVCFWSLCFIIIILINKDIRLSVGNVGLWCWRFFSQFTILLERSQGDWCFETMMTNYPQHMVDCKYWANSL